MSPTAPPTATNRSKKPNRAGAAAKHTEHEANLAWNRSFWAKYEWPQDGDEWSGPFGGTQAMWNGVLWPRIRALVPCKQILEIAPGHGRCSQFLRGLCDRLTLVDLVPDCIDACRRRFGEAGADNRIAYAVNDGRTLPMVPDESINLAFSWDSLVHVDREVMRSYVRELGRVLTPGGYAFIHHSNLGAHAGQLAGLDPGRDLHGRHASMTAEAFRHDCRASGLRCLSQELVPWGSTGLWLDAFSLCVRDESRVDAETIVVERTDWAAEVHLVRRTARLYQRATPA